VPTWTLDRFCPPSRAATHASGKRSLMFTTRCVQRGPSAAGSSRERVVRYCGIICGEESVSTVRPKFHRIERTAKGHDRNGHHGGEGGQVFDEREKLSGGRFVCLRTLAASVPFKNLQRT
jgi:hypothetical protein